MPINLGYVSIVENKDYADQPPPQYQLVIRQTRIKINYDYPFKNGTIVEYESANGFTRKELIDIIIDQYKKMYDQEEETSTIKARPIGDTSNGGYLTNRCTTDGVWGIWGHAIEDLILHSMHQDKKDASLWHLGIDS